MLTLTMMNDNDFASKFKATIHIRLNNSFNYSHLADQLRPSIQYNPNDRAATGMIKHNLLHLSSLSVQHNVIFSNRLHFHTNNAS